MPLLQVASAGRRAESEMVREGGAGSMWAAGVLMLGSQAGSIEECRIGELSRICYLYRSSKVLLFLTFYGGFTNFLWRLYFQDIEPIFFFLFQI